MTPTTKLPETREVSRRDFIKTSAATAVIGAVGALELSRSAYAGGGDTIKIGLIGCGDRGAGAALNAMDADPGTKLVAMADLFEDRAKAKRKLLQEKKPNQVAVDDDHCFVGFDAYRKVIESSDVVLIACASRFHPQYLKAAIAAGKHVFLEKPHAIDPVGVRSVVASCEEAKKKNLSVVSGLVYRYNPGIGAVVKQIWDGAIGEVLSMECNYLRAPYRMVERKPGQKEIDYQYANWYHFAWLSADDVVQSLIHNFDKMLWINHQATPLNAHGLGGRSSSFGETFGDVFDHHSLVYEFPNEVKLFAHCRTQVNCYANNSDVIIGTKGRAHITPAQQWITGEKKWRYAGAPFNAYQLEHEALFGGIRAGKPVNNGDYMWHTTLFSILGQLACYTGQQLTWEEVAKSNFSFGPDNCDFTTEPTIKPQADGTYPVPVPGKTRMI